MKLNLRPVHLICIILVQLILIDAFLIICFYKKLNIGPKADAKTAAGVLDSKGLVAVLMKVDKSGKEDVGAAGQKNKYDEFNVMQDFIQRFGLDKQGVHEFRITGRNKKYKSFIATAYDLSYECCGKYPSHPEYGITFSGKPAVKGRTVAVDPEVIPLGSRMYIEFPKEYSYLNGWYVAEDTGSKIKGNIIDIFLGESAPHETKKFGRRRIRVQVISPDGNKGGS